MKSTKVSDLAFVLLVTKAEADVDVPLAVLRQVLALHQGNAQHAVPHLVPQLVLGPLCGPLVWSRLVLLCTGQKDEEGETGEGGCGGVGHKNVSSSLPVFERLRPPQPANLMVFTGWTQRSLR